MARPVTKSNDMNGCSRRTLLASVAVAAAASLARPLFAAAMAPESAFKIAVINDEISQDFDHACYVASHDFEMRWIELRSMWSTNVIYLSSAQIEEARKILDKYKLQVTDIASPLFKTDWPGAPKSPYGSKSDLHGAPEVTFKEQDEILERSITLAREFKTAKVRCFDFWRLEDVAPYRKAIDEKLRSAAETCGQQGILLVLENEFACNTATGREAARTLNAIQTQVTVTILVSVPALPSTVSRSPNRLVSSKFIFYSRGVNGQMPCSRPVSMGSRLLTKQIAIGWKNRCSSGTVNTSPYPAQSAASTVDLRLE